MKNVSVIHKSKGFVSYYNHSNCPINSIYRIHLKSDLLLFYFNDSIETLPVDIVFQLYNFVASFFLNLYLHVA